MSPTVSASIHEFEHLATLLRMPVAERRGVLNLSGTGYAALRFGTVPPDQPARPELERRLTYVLPLMRRMVANTAPPAAP